MRIECEKFRTQRLQDQIQNVQSERICGNACFELCSWDEVQFLSSIQFF